MALINSHTIHDKTMIEKYLQDLEKRIDSSVEDELYNNWIDFTDGHFKGIIFSPKRKESRTTEFEWPEILVNDAIEDHEKMALSQFKACSDALGSGNGRLMCIRCNYGTGIIPSLFGAELFIMDRSYNILPGIKPLVGGIDRIRRLVDDGLPDIRCGLGGKVFETAEYFRGIMAKYPKISKYVHIYHPDTQGPMDICEMLWGSNIFLDITDEPGLTHRLLDLVTETYIKYMNEWKKIIPASENVYSVHWSMLHKGKIMLRNDSAMNFSAAYYNEFMRPYDQRLLKKFEGGAMHFCGKGDHYIELASGLEGLYAINMSQPEYNDMENIYRSTVDKGIKLIGFSGKQARQAVKDGRDLHSCVHSI